MNPVVLTQHLGVAFDGIPVLRDASVSVESGEVVALVGGNGSGKTTLLRAMLGLVPLSTGESRLFGTDVRRFRQWWRVGYVPQRGALTMRTATVAEVVASGRLARRRPFVPARDRESVERALARVDLLERRSARFIHLSGGQQQRVLIARALVGEPELLLLDEPLAAMDVPSQDRLADLILGLNAEDGLTVVVVLHELGPFAPGIDRAVTLSNGRVVANGPLMSTTQVHAHPHGHEVELAHTPPLVIGAMDSHHQRH